MAFRKRITEWPLGHRFKDVEGDYYRIGSFQDVMVWQSMYTFQYRSFEFHLPSLYSMEYV